MSREFVVDVPEGELSPRRLLEAFGRIPSEYLDDPILLTVRSLEPGSIRLSFVVDDAEGARAKWRAGDPDYLIFLDVG